MAGFLAMIHEEVVKTAAIRSFGTSQCAPHLRAVLSARRSFFRGVVHLGFCGNEPSPEELRGASQE